MGPEPTASDGPLLVLAPFGRDAETALSLTAASGIRAIECRDLADLTARIDDPVGALLLTAESLRGDGASALAERLATQPTWSDLPVVFLTSRSRTAGRARAAALPAWLAHAIVLERPMSGESLVSAVSGALAARRRQYQIRDQIALLESQARALAEAGARLTESEARFRAITDSMPQIVWSCGPDGRHDFFNERFYEYTGMARDRAIGYPLGDLVHEDDRERSRAAWQRSVGQGTAYTVEFRMRARDGSFRWFLGQALPVRGHDGAIARWYGSNTDIDDQVRARDALADFSIMLERQVNDRTAALHAEMAERQSVEAALRQSQKMEAIGQLTGGIAHDFNNFLTGIIGNLDILKRRVEREDFKDAPRLVDGATASAKRAAALTHRLLAFSRQQTLAPKSVDLVDTIESMRSLLRQTLSERIALIVDADPDTPRARADPNQLESALLNMAINARDAMPDGGTLTVRTGSASLDEETLPRFEHVEPGRYALLSIQDDGVGMSPETLARATEPFFTTKPLGQGTGLGLSMIHGFARQSHGHLALHSTVGQGTTATLYLPIATADDSVAAEHAPTTPAPEGDGETILVVEDDAVVRALVLESLRELGYATLAAPDAGVASETLDSSRRIDLLISDVGLPGMNGRQLADIARRQRPALKVLFMTGYADIESVRSGELEEGMSVIPKPFSLDAFATRIREIMG